MTPMALDSIPNIPARTFWGSPERAAAWKAEVWSSRNVYRFDLDGVTGGSISWGMFTDAPGSGSISLIFPPARADRSNVFRPLVDRIALWYIVEVPLSPRWSPPGDWPAAGKLAGTGPLGSRWSIHQIPGRGTIARMEAPRGVYLLAGDIDWTRDEVVSGATYPLVDTSVILRRDLLTHGVSYPAGSPGTAAIRDLFAGSGHNTWYTVDNPSLLLRTTLYIPPGTPRMTAINLVADAIGYQAVSATPNGLWSCTPHLDLTARSMAWDYRAAPDGITDPEIRIQTPTTEIPNRVVLVSTESDTTPALTAVATNSDPGSVWSTISRDSTITRYEEGVEAATLQILQDKADRLLLEGNSAVVRHTYTHPLLPVNIRDAVTAVDGHLMQVVDWSCDLDPTAKQTTTARRFVDVNETGPTPPQPIPRDALTPGTYRPTPELTGVYPAITRTRYNQPGAGRWWLPPGTYTNLDFYGDVELAGDGKWVFTNCYFHGASSHPSSQTGCVRAVGITGAGYATFTDCTFRPDSPSWYRDGLVGHKLTVRRCQFADGCDGFGSSAGTGGALVEACYFGPGQFWRQDPAHSDGTHNDGAQFQGGGPWIFIGNNVICAVYNAPGSTAPPARPIPGFPGLYQGGSGLMINQTTAPIHPDTRAENNWFQHGYSGIQAHAGTAHGNLTFHWGANYYAAGSFRDEYPPNPNVAGITLVERTGSGPKVIDPDDNLYTRQYWWDAPRPVGQGDLPKILTVGRATGIRVRTEG